MEAQILKEDMLGNYIFVDKKPKVVSSLGALPKSGGSVRLIHDLSRPMGGINQFDFDSFCSYHTLDLATQNMSPNCYLRKVDFMSAYRSIPIDPRNYPIMGLSWHFQGSKKPSFMFDSKLANGSHKAFKIFSSVSDAIARMLKKRGVFVVNYLDDFLIISDTISPKLV